MARTYKFKDWANSFMIVDEYENGRYRNTYYGIVKDNGYSVDIYPMKGRKSDSRTICAARRLRMDEIIREEPREAVTPAPSAPSAPVEEYDPTAWHRQNGEQMEGVQLTLRGLEGL